MEKNQEAVINGTYNHADAEKYLVYVDGTTYKAFGGLRIEYRMRIEYHMCVASEITDGTRWRNYGCKLTRGVLCEFNCDNVNDYSGDYSYDDSGDYNNTVDYNTDDYNNTDDSNNTDDYSGDYNITDITTPQPCSFPNGYTVASSNTRKAYKKLNNTTVNFINAGDKCKGHSAWLVMPKTTDDMADILVYDSKQSKGHLKESSLF